MKRFKKWSKIVRPLLNKMEFETFQIHRRKKYEALENWRDDGGSLGWLELDACSNGSKNADSKDITMWVHFSNTDPEGKALAKNIKDFNKSNKHGYHATVKYIPRSGSGGGYEDKLNAAVNSGSLPDVLTLDGPNTAAYANAKIIQPGWPVYHQEG